jgi:hypothetical protein
MANGVYALPVKLREPSSTEDKQIELDIGIAMANAVIASCRALTDYEVSGAMSSTVRAENGAWLARLYMLQQEASGKIDFTSTARREGRRLFYDRHGVAFWAYHGTNFTERTLDVLIDNTLEVLAKITASERELAH